MPHLYCRRLGRGTPHEQHNKRWFHCIDTRCHHWSVPRASSTCSLLCVNMTVVRVRQRALHCIVTLGHCCFVFPQGECGIVGEFLYVLQMLTIRRAKVHPFTQLHHKRQSDSDSRQPKDA